MLVILANNVAFPAIKKILPNLIPASVASTVDKIDDYADLVAGLSSCFALTAIAKKRGNAALASQIAEVRVTLAKLPDDTVQA